MKKQYQSPLTKVVRTQCASMLCGSVTSTEKVEISTNEYGEGSWE